MFSIIDREAMEREEAELKAAQAAKETEKKAAIPLVPSSRVMPPLPPFSRWDGTDTLRTPTTDTVASEPAPKESKSLRSWFFTEEVEVDRFAEPEPTPPKSESFFSGWTIFETLFSSRTNTEGDTTTTTGFFSGPLPRRTGWLFIDMFLSEKTGTTARKPGFSLLTKFLMLAVPLIAFAGYYQYAQVSGATILGKTLSNSVNLERGLVGHWTFDGGDMSTTTAYDVSGNDKHAVFNVPYLYYGTRYFPQAGRIGQGLYLSADSSQKITVPPDALHQNLSALSVGGWVKRMSVGSSHFISKGDGSTSPASGWMLRLESSGAISFRVGYATTDLIRTSVTGLIDDGGWSHVIAVWDGSSSASNIRLYIDGVEVSGYAVTQNASGARDSEDNNGIRFGNSSGGSANLHGTLDDVRIYNRVLSAKEIERLYKMGEGVKINTNTIPAGSTLEDGLVGYWSFNGADFTDKVYDRSGQSNHGYLVNMATTSAKVPGKVGQGLLFDGTNDYVNLGSPASLDNLPALTYSVWIKPTEYIYGAVAPTATKGATDLCSATYTGWAISNRESDKNGIDFCAAFSTTALKVMSYNGVLTPSVWHHLVVTWNGTNQASGAKIYLDGTEISYASQQNGIGTYEADDANDLLIGRTAYPGYTYNGTLDEVRIYNRVLSADEVRQLYESGGGVTIKNCREDSVQDADGNTYNTLAIGSQCWLDRNMNVGTRIGAATAQTNNGTIEKYCYSNSDANCTTNNPNKPDGGLYQWNEAMQYSTTEGARGICPAGFHIPTDAEWHQLEKFLTDSGQTCDGNRSAAYSCNPAGTKLIPNGASGLEFNLAGNGDPGTFYNRGIGGSFWSSSPSGGNAWRRVVSSESAQVYRQAATKPSGLSVRCLQDS